MRVPRDVRGRALERPLGDPPVPPGWRAVGLAAAAVAWPSSAVAALDPPAESAGVATGLMAGRC